MAKPIQGTKQSDLNLMGTDGSDTIQGKDGNDYITGGKGNDNIDGGNGIDTAVYSGNFAQYQISAKGTGNDKITVSDSVAGRDGTDSLKQVEYLQFADATFNVKTGTLDQWHYHVNATLDDSAQDPGAPGTMIAGSGIPRPPRSASLTMRAPIRVSNWVSRSIIAAAHRQTLMFSQRITITTACCTFRSPPVQTRATPIAPNGTLTTPSLQASTGSRPISTTSASRC